MRLTRVLFLVGVILSASFAIGCDDPLALPAASLPNVVDTVTIYALRGTDIAKPSGFRVATGVVIRTDQPGFDLAFDIDDAGVPLMYPAGALGLARDPGVLKVTDTFEGVTSAPLTKTFLDHVPLAIPPGTVFVGRSAPFGGDCGVSGSLPRYGKFHVLAVDTVTRTVVLEVLVNLNCGYRDLRPGVPSA